MSASNSVRAEPIEDEGESRYRLTDIIGTSTVSMVFPGTFGNLGWA